MSRAIRKVMRKFVCDTSTITNIKEPNDEGYSPANSFYKDFNDGWIEGDYLNIFPALAVFEVEATVSKKHRKGEQILRGFYLMGDNAILYDVNQELISKCVDFFMLDGFDTLQGADLVFACIAYIEDAYFLTLDRKLALHAGKQIEVIDLNENTESANYRDLFK